MDGSRIALVTGGSSGFGRRIVLTLAQHGVHAIAAFRGSHGGFGMTAGAIEASAEAAGGQVECLRMDVTDHASVQHGVRTILERLGRIDILVNCAGYGLLGPMECTTIDQARQLFEVNVFGTMRMAQAVVPTMRRQCQGVILNVGSDVGIHANFFQSAYAASKFAIHGLSQVMRWELQGFGIRVAVIDPGWYATEFADSIVPTFSQGDAAVHYEALIRAWKEGVARVEDRMRILRRSQASLGD